MVWESLEPKAMRATRDLLRRSQARLRAVLVVLTLGLGVVTVLFSRRNKSLYDMVCGSAVVYAWRALPESRQNR